MKSLEKTNNSEVKFFRPECDALIFDLDGTLWDAAETSAIGWQSVIKELDLDIIVNRDTIRSISGLPFAKCVESIFGDYAASLPDLIEQLDEAEQHCIISRGGRLYPHAEEVISTLSKKYNLFLVSNCQEWYLEAFFAHSGFRPFFKEAICIGQTGRPKSHNIKAIIDRHHLRKPIYVGDTHWDQEAAFFAGAKFIFASYGFGKLSVASPNINSLTELLDAMSAEKTLPTIDYKQLLPSQLPEAKTFYKSANYHAPLTSKDIFFAAYDSDTMVGLVRLTHEEGVHVLRGMQVKPAYQFLGIGTHLIRMLETTINQQGCFCIPHAWLDKFYGQIGFVTVDQFEKVPPFLVNRYREVKVKYPHLILMERPAK